MRSWIGAIAIVAVGVAIACSSDETTTENNCRPVIGVIIAAPGIDLQVRDPFGRAQAIGTTATVRRSDNTSVETFVQDTLNIYSAINVAGTFRVTLHRPFYIDATVDNVQVTPSGCVVNQTTVPVTLQLAAGAPALRSIVIVGAEFLGQPGAQAHLLAHFDANPEVSNAVTWKVSDATLAGVDANGVVTAKCTKSGGTVRVAATAVADGVTSATVDISVAPAASCP